jgi:hypothetical protein
MTKIDYSKLNDRIVEQAYNSANRFMTAEQKQQLIDGKLERAKHYRDSLQQSSVYVQLED